MEKKCFQPLHFIILQDRHTHHSPEIKETKFSRNAQMAAVAGNISGEPLCGMVWGQSSHLECEQDNGDYCGF